MPDQREAERETKAAANKTLKDEDKGGLERDHP